MAFLIRQLGIVITIIPYIILGSSISKIYASGCILAQNTTRPSLP